MTHPNNTLLSVFQKFEIQNPAKDLLYLGLQYLGHIITNYQLRLWLQAKI